MLNFQHMIFSLKALEYCCCFTFNWAVVPPANTSLHPSGQHVGDIFSHPQVFCCRIHPIPSFEYSVLRQVSSLGSKENTPFWINSMIFSLLATNASSSSSVHSKAVLGFSKCLNGDIISVLQKQYVTWFTYPYHDLTSEMLLYWNINGPSLN